MQTSGGLARVVGWPTFLLDDIGSMKHVEGLLLAFVLLLASPLASSADGTEAKGSPRHRVWEPASPVMQEPIWPAGTTIAPPASQGAERFSTQGKQIAGRGWTAVERVSEPTMSIYPPIGKNTGAAMVVFPGGGYRVLAIDLEGTEVCDWVTRMGVTCVLLKYRVPGSGPWWSDACNCRQTPSVPMALQDAQRTISLLRKRASELGVDPHRIGVIGFSAGGRMVADVSNHLARSYADVDDADRESMRPDFAIALYPGHLWKGPGLTLDAGLTISPDAPPTLIIQAGDDPTDDVRHSLTYYLALQQAGVPVELHLYAHGGHAFGLRETTDPVTHWRLLAEKWMASLGVIPARAE